MTLAEYIFQADPSFCSWLISNNEPLLDQDIDTLTDDQIEQVEERIVEYQEQDCEDSRTSSEFYSWHHGINQ
jgi:hypothetical protein